MRPDSSFVIAAKIAVDLSAACIVALRARARYIVWLWRAKKKSAAIRSLAVSLSAQIGDSVLIEQGVFIDGASSIGDYSYINRDGSVENATIGKFCSIARGVMIGPAAHDYTNISTHPFWHQPFYGFNVRERTQVAEPERVEIGDDVWIGCNVVIMPGVTVHRGAVIGAGSIVTRDVGAYEIWAGVPAKKIKQRFHDDLIHAVLELNWCEFDKESINSIIIPAMGDVAGLIAARKQ